MRQPDDADRPMTAQEWADWNMAQMMSAMEDDLPDDLEGDFHAGEIRDTRAAPECVERDRYDDDDLNEWDSYTIYQDYEAEAGPCQPD
jgi:hypothetical protein